jgi:hypothetical protein
MPADKKCAPDVPPKAVSRASGRVILYGEIFRVKYLQESGLYLFARSVPI